MDKIVKEWTDRQLLNAITEMKQDEPMGLISNGIIRGLARLITTETHGILEHASALRLAQDSVYKEAAIRWYNMF